MKRLEEESKAEERKSEDPGREDALPPPPSPPREGEALQVEEIDEELEDEPWSTGYLFVTA